MSFPLQRDTQLWLPCLVYCQLKSNTPSSTTFGFGEERNRKLNQIKFMTNITMNTQLK